MGTALRWIGVAVLAWGACTDANAEALGRAAAADQRQIRQVIARYVEAVDAASPALANRIWSHSPEVSFIYPLGEEHGLDAIDRDIYEKAMGGTFSKRDLQPGALLIHVYGDTAWSEFHWVFHATLRKDGSPMVSKGVETQIYRREQGQWRLVHVHYSGDVVNSAATAP